VRTRNHRLIQPHARIVPLLQQARLWEPTKINSVNVDARLICALLERWRPETHTFILPTGECTITLEDVHMLLGLKVDGIPVTIEREITWDYFEDFLGKQMEDIEKSRKTVKLKWLSSYMTELSDDPRPEAVVYHFRVYCLYIIGTLLMPDTTGNKVHIKWLALLDKNPEEIGEYSWGSACLAWLYRGMCDAAHTQVHDVPGCTLLIQAWAYSRILAIAPVPKKYISSEFPFANMWVK